MNTLINPKQQEMILAEWRDAEAKIWLFHVTHNRMAIHLFRKGEQEGLYIIAVGCLKISGPFNWKMADITIVTEPPDQWGEVRRHIKDAQAGFDLLCSDVTIAVGLGKVFSDPFDGFFSEE